MRGFTERTKSILKLKKFGKEEELSISDYGLPTQLGRKGASTKTNKSVDQIQKEKEFAQKYGIGYKILSKIGFDATKGLGKNQDGILEPVESISKQALIA